MAGSAHLPVRLLNAAPTVVVTALLSADIALALRDALPLETPVVHLKGIDEAAAALAEYLDALFIFRVPEEADSTHRKGLVTLRRQFPLAYMIALFHVPSSSPSALLEIGRTGLASVLSYSVSPKVSELRQVIAVGSHEAICQRIWRQLPEQPEGPLRTLLKCALRSARGPITLDRLAIAAGMHERTLRKYCAAHNLPSPQWIIGWARMLVVSYFLAEPGRSASSIAKVLEFPSLGAMRNQFHRYTGRPLREADPGLAVAETYRSISERLGITTHRETGPSLRIVR